MKRVRKVKEVEKKEEVPAVVEVPVENVVLNLEENVKTEVFKTVKGGFLNVRKCPNGKIVDVLVSGTKVKVLDEQDGWTCIGKERWVGSDYLE